ncbi:hypothetical protein GSF70_15875 [Flavobacteriaceae bacterium W22]|nr:hypothetical protein [Flavobacteriaceae bacterium W22]
MCEKKRFLVKTVFEKAKNEIPRGNKSSVASYLSSLFEDRYGFEREERAYIRYYTSLVEKNEDYNIDDLALDYLSKYLKYNDFKDFCDKVNIENDDLKTFSLSFNDISEKIHQIFITVTPTVLLPDFMKKNGMGILEMTFVLLLVTGGVVFSNNKSKHIDLIGECGSPAVDKPFMYWNKDRYMATDSSYLGPQINVIPMNPGTFTYLKKITRPDTLNINNFKGKVWYDKSNNRVDFFTSFGRHPENGKTLKEATDRIIENYAGSDNENQD